MLEAILSGLSQLVSPLNLAMLLLGVIIGLLVGFLPGVSVMFAYAIVFPFIIHLDAGQGIPLLIGIMAVAVTGDAVSSILVGIPGGPATAALIPDGHAMAKRGEAARALSGAFVVAAVGGVIGALFLAGSVPILRLLVRQWLSAEFFMICVLALAMTAALTGARPSKGAIAASLGLLLAAVGTAAASPYHRFAFGIVYLFEGVPMIILALGMFAIPEIFEMMVTGSAIAGGMKVTGAGWLTGLKDALEHRWLVLRAGLMGVWIGFLPGLGPTAASWMAYGHAAQSAKDRSQFGKGDVRGVLAPMCADNACKGGDLMLTLAFGVPGSNPMALFLIALTVFGFQIGPRMIVRHLDTVFLTIWSLSIAVVLGSVFCFLLIKPLAKVASVPGHVLAPIILLFVLIGAYSNNHSWGDLFLLVVLGILGIFMKRYDFSRSAMLIAFVLGPIIERQFYLTVQRYGTFGWLSRPWVIVFIILLVVSMFLAIRGQGKQADKEAVGR